MAPQSNQRGIETVDSFRLPQYLDGPQSNQRGIETPLQDNRDFGEAPGLNRTSVGLKRSLLARTWWSRSVPQSNQRGIETLLPLPKGLRSRLRASIEPAWD